VRALLGLVDEEIDSIARDGVTDDELEVAVGYLTGAYVLGLEDTGSRMARLGGALTTHGRIRTVAEQLSRWRSVTHADVARVAARILGADRSLSVVGPVTKRDAAAWIR
jgi:predicted Zn-dependent peptidase